MSTNGHQNGKTPIIVADNSQAILVINEVMTIRLSGQATGNKFAVVESLTPPGNGVPLLHTHPQQETFHILEGRYEIYGQDEAGHKVATPAPAGSIVHVPGGVPHGFRNVGDTVGKVMMTFEPAGNMERFFEEIGIPVEDKAHPPTPAGPPDMEALLKVCAKYNIYFMEAPV
ncbi:MAG TPA: cupin domain-containing protein [Anaerolineae bacterium]|nr:cupin domain-containing protein [Anaerolineales bacterium]HRV95790.1 cupin domain-containing protein [Anaerolineae bacterium]